MKRKFNKIILLVIGLSLVSCGGVKNYTFKDYECNMEFKNDTFKIMQLTDIHLGRECDNRSEMKRIKFYVEDNNPDLVVITGDTFLDADKKLVKYFFDEFDSYNVPFAFTYGNHDLQGIYNNEFIHNTIKATKNAVYKEYTDDNLFGRTNYYINLKNNEETLYRLYIIDSNSYKFDTYQYYYDIIHDDQLEHINNINDADPVLGLGFFHIPLEEYLDTYQKYEKGEARGQGKNLEGSFPGYKNNDTLKRLYDSGIRATFVGHDHLNYSDVIYDKYDEDFILSYGVKATYTIYGSKDILGCKMITLDKNNVGIGLNNIEAKLYGYSL